MAMAAGASLGNMSEAWWIPAIHVPGDEMRGRAFARLILMERTWPRSIIVNRKGERFANEAANYNAIGRAFHTFDPNSFEFSNLPAWLIVDSAFKFPIAGQAVRPDAPDWIRRADTLAGLAAEIGVDATSLEATVARFNDGVALGEDPDFHRGESAHDSYNGDRSQEPPFTTLGPLDTPPYSAAEIESGSLGTKGGPKTNTKAQVLRATGGVIPGLYAVGNAMDGTTGHGLRRCRRDPRAGDDVRLSRRVERRAGTQPHRVTSSQARARRPSGDLPGRPRRRLAPHTRCGWFPLGAPAGRLRARLRGCG